MVTHDRSSLIKALAYISGGLGFFLIVMHQASQLFK